MRFFVKFSPDVTVYYSSLFITIGVEIAKVARAEVMLICGRNVTYKRRYQL
jgi:hypothetical protein